MGKTHLCLEILKKWEDNFSSTPVTQIIWLSKTKCSAKFRQELESISRSLNVPLHVFDSHGVLTPSYQRAFKKYHDREKSEGLSETRQDIDDREVESEGEIEKDKKNKEDDDASESDEDGKSDFPQKEANEMEMEVSNVYKSFQEDETNSC